MAKFDITEAKAYLEELIEAAIAGGEEIIIVKDNQPLVKLQPLTIVKRRPQPGSAKGLIEISDDFDAPLEEFKEYM